MIVSRGPKPKKIGGQGGIGNESSHIGEGETGSTFHDMTPLWIGLDTIGIDPGNCRHYHTEVQMIDHRVSVACLALGAADLLFDLLTRRAAEGFEHDHLVIGQHFSPLAVEEHRDGLCLLPAAGCQRRYRAEFRTILAGTPALTG